ncbi:hypothetical protein EDB81DRAFT_859778 [Dactylonectria macrodidyma]|uniref:Uncharacterized protein n=1 Tax=Dactylonectria macrodidyma TaxID=307937 RepID=A0A9P9E512_9HYPO|nr:hypothetical protein EDB81DRAFT_859778 [Dactylonectria macrodidyma]
MAGLSLCALFFIHAPKVTMSGQQTFAVRTTPTPTPPEPDDILQYAQSFKEALLPIFPIILPSEIEPLLDSYRSHAHSPMPDDDYVVVRLILALGKTVRSPSPSIESGKHMKAIWFAEFQARLFTQPSIGVMEFRAHVLVCLLCQYHGTHLLYYGYAYHALQQMAKYNLRAWDTEVSLAALSLFYLTSECPSASSVSLMSNLLHWVRLPGSAFLCQNFGSRFAELALVYVKHIHQISTCEPSRLDDLHHSYKEQIESQSPRFNLRTQSLLASQVAMSMVLSKIRSKRVPEDSIPAMGLWLNQAAQSTPVDRGRIVDREILLTIQLAKLKPPGLRECAARTLSFCNINKPQTIEAMVNCQTLLVLAKAVNSEGGSV